MFSVSVVIVLLILILPKIRIKTETFGITKQETVAIKGILCLMIFLNHFSGWFANPDLILYFFIHCGSFMVSVFFFLSAYGICKSSDIKKQTFKSLVLRILKIFIPFWISDFIYLLIHYSMDIPLNIEVTKKAILLSVVNLSEIVYSSWFVSAIVFLYIIYFFSLKIKNANTIWLLFIVLIVASFIVPEIWLTYFAFPVGLLISKKESLFISLNKRKYILTLIFTVIFVLSAILFKYFCEANSDNTYLSSMSDALSGASFAFLVYMLLTRIHIGNKVLLFIGEISYEIYLIHGLGIFFANKFFTPEQPYAFIFVALIFTFVTSFIVNRINKLIFKLLPIHRE